MVQNPIVNEFMKRLQDAERTRDTKRLSELFAEDAELLNLTRPISHTKQSDPTSSPPSIPSFPPQQFWSQYLHAFSNIQSHFTEVMDDGRTAVLEWHSSGQLPTELPIEYNGVSILEYENGRITRFRTYYDSAAFLSYGPLSKPYSETVGIPEVTNQATS